MLFACDQLRNGKADLILTGGVDELSKFLFRGFSELHFLATDQGHREKFCPYDKMRNGLVLGEEAGILTIENEEHARLRRARIHGYIQGYSLIERASQGDGAEDLGRSMKMALRGRKDISIASGGLRMVANLLSMENGFIPPTINCLDPDPTCDLHHVVNQRLDRKIETALHLRIPPENCFSAILAGIEWSG